MIGIEWFYFQTLVEMNLVYIWIPLVQSQTQVICTWPNENNLHFWKPSKRMVVWKMFEHIHFGGQVSFFFQHIANLFRIFKPRKVSLQKPYEVSHSTKLMVQIVHPGTKKSPQIEKNIIWTKVPLLGSKCEFSRVFPGVSENFWLSSWRRFVLKFQALVLF